MPNYPTLNKADQDGYVVKIVDLASKLPGGANLTPDRVVEYLSARTEKGNLAGFTGTEQTILKTIMDKHAKLSFKESRRSRTTAPPETPAEASPPERVIDITAPVEPVAAPEPMPEPEASDAPGTRDEEPEPERLPGPRVVTEAEWDEGSIDEIGDKPGVLLSSLHGPTLASTASAAIPGVTPTEFSMALPLPQDEPAPIPEDDGPAPNTGLLGPADVRVRPLPQWSGITREAEKPPEPDGANDGPGEADIGSMSDVEALRTYLRWNQKERAEFKARAESVLRRAHRLTDLIAVVEIAQEDRRSQPGNRANPQR